MTRTLTMTVLATAVALSAIATTAQAQGRGGYFDPSREAPPVVVRKALPFTESGTNAPVGYENEYVVDQTTANLPVYSSFRPDAFGNDVLPGRFGEIGRGAY